MRRSGSDDEQYSDDEAARRATEALRRSLRMPHTPQKEMVSKVGRTKSPRSRKPSTSAPEDR